MGGGDKCKLTDTRHTCHMFISIVMLASIQLDLTKQQLNRKTILSAFRLYRFSAYAQITLKLDMYRWAMWRIQWGHIFFNYFVNTSITTTCFCYNINGIPRRIIIDIYSHFRDANFHNMCCTIINKHIIKDSTNLLVHLTSLGGKKVYRDYIHTEKADRYFWEKSMFTSLSWSFYYVHGIVYLSCLLEMKRCCMQVDRGIHCWMSHKVQFHQGR